LRRVCICWGRNGLEVGLVDWGRHGDWHDGRVNHGASTRRGDRVGPLAAVTSVRQLVVVKTACQLSLFQVSSDVLVRHLLETSLEKIHLLGTGLA
jgi:hypothetical protein